MDLKTEEDLLKNLNTLVICVPIKLIKETVINKTNVALPITKSNNFTMHKGTKVSFVNNTIKIKNKLIIVNMVSIVDLPMMKMK